MPKLRGFRLLGRLQWQQLRAQAIAFTGILIGLSGVSLAANPSQYALKDLGTFGGKSSYPAGINGSGQITGDSTLAGDQITHAFIYTNGAMKDIGTPPGSTFSSGRAINSFAELAVASDLLWAYNNGSWINLDPGAPPTLSYPLAINDNGHVAGLTSGQAFFYDGTIHILPSQAGGGGGSVNGINNSDVMVGQNNFNPGMLPFGFIYDAASGSITPLSGLAGGTTNAPGAINARGDITGSAGYGTLGGTSGGGFPYHAFLRDTTGEHDLGTLGGTQSGGWAINSGSEVVGDSTLAGDVVTHAFLYSNGAMVDLNTLVTSSPLAKYVTLTAATGINDSGWIVATGTDSRTGNTHAYLLEPPSVDGTVTPPVSQIVDASLNLWTLSGGQAYENGRATPSATVIELLLSKGVIYQENVHRSWWAWNGTGWVGTASPLIPSASGTSVPTAANIVDNGLNLWALSGGQAYENGTLTPSGGVIQLLFDGNVVYQENLHHAWWMWNATSHAWMGSADPRVPSANETSVPPATQITDSSLNTWILSKGQVYEDGQLTPSGGVIRLLLLNNVVYQENLHDNWWKWVNGRWVACAAPLAPSANNTTIPAASQIIDNALNIWTVSGGVVYENHAPTASGDVTLLLFYGTTVYQQNVHGNWWRWSGSTWVSTPKPRP